MSASAPSGGEPRNLVGVRLSPYGRTLELDAGQLRLDAGERVVVDDRRGGTPVGVVAVPSAWRAARGPVARGPLARVLRRAEPRDLEKLAAQEARVAEALAFAQERARSLQLALKVFRVDFAPGGERTTFTFSAEQRVDFRELVRELAARFNNRIELRQVGVRDEAKMVGGIGSCGRELCCSTFLPQFAPVSIRMAKNQNIALNPAKVTGQCGRLKCCLVYEEAQYVEAAKGLPRLGKRVQTPDGVGKVEDVEILAGRVRVSFPDRPPASYGRDDVRPMAAPTGALPAPERPAGAGEGEAEPGSDPDGTPPSDVPTN